ncbi:MAG: endoflagellar protein [Acidimicrobiia bacterium]
MIVLHRLTHPDQPFHLNPDLIVTIESTPDTVISLGNASKLVVIETPDEIAERIRDWRASILARASLVRVIRPPAG